MNYSNSSGKVAGWTVAISTGIYGSLGWDWSPPASAWYCRTLWNHYQYTLDKAYLASIYPVMKSACEFWQVRLIKDPTTGLLIDDKDWSPEQGPHQQLGMYVLNNPGRVRRAVLCCLICARCQGSR